jgi:Cys-rich protein (TIGR01571 family)
VLLFLPLLLLRLSSIENIFRWFLLLCKSLVPRSCCDKVESPQGIRLGTNLLITLCLSPFVSVSLSLRWLARTAYGIPGTASDDLLTGCFCPCCSVNQIIQTTKAYGNPPNSGTAFNQRLFTSPLVSTDPSSCSTCLESFCCTPCTIGTIAERGLGMPWWMGCVCLTPCSVRNLIRYHYRLKGNDLMEELCLPCSLYSTASCLALCFYCFSPCICLAMCPTYVSFVSQLSQETETHGTGEYHRYLIGYTLSSDYSNSVSPTRGSEVGTELNLGPGGGKDGAVAAERILYDEQRAVLQQSLLDYEVRNEGLHPPPPPPPPLPEE